VDGQSLLFTYDDDYDFLTFSFSCSEELLKFMDRLELGSMSAAHQQLWALVMISL